MSMFNIQLQFKKKNNAYKFINYAVTVRKSKNNDEN